jgi:hypothetical protein
MVVDTFESSLPDHSQDLKNKLFNSILHHASLWRCLRRDRDRVCLTRSVSPPYSLTGPFA